MDIHLHAILLVDIHHILTRGTPSENKCIFRSLAVRKGGCGILLRQPLRRLKLMALRPSSESYQRAAAENSTARCHVHTNSHDHVEGVLTAVTHGARHDGRYEHPHMLICANNMATSLPSASDSIFVVLQRCEIKTAIMIIIHYYNYALSLVS